MSEPAVRTCPDHGYFAGGSCPVCGAPSRIVLSAERRTRLSKFASGALRHFPGDAGLEPDDGGWVGFDALEGAVREQYDWADREALEGVIATDPKGRFERAEDRARAAYGHSIDVELDVPDTPVPDRLYHGTAPSALGSIRRQGLEPMSRQQVHLSGTVEDAHEVGRRHADDPVVLGIDAAAMERDGHRIVRRGRGVYTTDRVPPEYLAERP